jgi:hypothetical protein
MFYCADLVYQSTPNPDRQDKRVNEIIFSSKTHKIISDLLKQEGTDGCMGQPALSTEQPGFVGAVSGMSLADIIQVKGGNRYSGCLIVENMNKCGTVYFRDGEIVHAEQANLSGE